MFELFWTTFEKCTGRKLELKSFNPNSPLCGIVVDADRAQFLGYGQFICNVMQRWYEGRVWEHDPIKCAKANGRHCRVHFIRSFSMHSPPGRSLTFFRDIKKNDNLTEEEKCLLLKWLNLSMEEIPKWEADVAEAAKKSIHVKSKPVFGI
jgi:hypothetical protein